MLSSLLGMLLFFSSIELGIVAGGYWSIITVPLGFVVAVLAKALANTRMMRSRLWVFGRNKFDSWKQMGQWIHMTNTDELDFIAGLSDEEWEPDYDNGGIAKDDNV